MEVGHEVTVWNRTPEKTKPLANAGAKVAATPADLASAVEATITMLTDGAAIDAVFGVRGLRTHQAQQFSLARRRGDRCRVQRAEWSFVG
jgi:3-hydroxyisobutyrate dehydrogenase-like beta-hydroxyacid dehydrogenase